MKYVLLATLLFLPSCLLPGVDCSSDEECESRWGAGARCVEIEGEDARLCQKPCASNDDCSPRVCQEGQCADPDEELDAGPVDASTDGGEPDSGAPDAGQDSGPLPECGGDDPCPAVANGTNACTAAGTCELTCATGYDECAASPGACTSVETLENCGTCGNAVTGVASTCAGGTPMCGAAAACAGDAALCGENATGDRLCVECEDDSQCGGGFCCQGVCYDESAQAEHCGCAPTVGEGSEADCTARDTEKVCVAGVCGCTDDGSAQCGTAADSLERLCDVGGNSGAGVCVEQSEAQCGVVGAVVPAGETSAVAGPCSPLLGGSVCVDPVGDDLGTCGCGGDGDCTSAVLVEGVPRQSADACSGDGCICLSEAGACGDAEPDCTVSAGCVDYQKSGTRCGVVGSGNCSDDALSDGSGNCVQGGCACNEQTDCSGGINVDACRDPVDGLGARCVCDGFTATGVITACPMGLECVTDLTTPANAGCEYNGTVYKTMADLVTALGL